MQITTNYNEEGKLYYINIISGKTELTIFKGAGITIKNERSASSNAWRSLGKTFWSWEEAIANYKRESTKDIVRKAKELFEADENRPHQVSCN